MKRSRPNAPVQERPGDADRKVLEVIMSKENQGIKKPQLRQLTLLPDTVITKSIQSLKAKNLIKEVNDIRNKRVKHLMGIGFEPSKEVTGGEWYTDGEFDVAFISELRRVCSRHIRKVEVATAEQISQVIAESGAFNEEIGIHQIEQIVKALVLDGEVEEVISSGIGEFCLVPRGKLCYKNSIHEKVPKMNAMLSIPCGVCPSISHCNPNGIISPTKCVYFEKWLDF